MEIENKILEQLDKELPDSMHYVIDNFKKELKNQQYRQAFLVVEDLKRVKNWSPSATLLYYLEKFWWEKAN